MKTFTFIICLLLISVVLNAQNRSDLALELQNMQKKYSDITQQITRINKFTNSDYRKMELKSAVISQKLDSTVNLLFDTGSQMWLKDYKDEFLYDSEFRNKSWIEKEWNAESHTWVLDYRAELGYDGNSRVNTLMSYDWDSDQNMEVVSGKFNFFYNSDGLTDSVVTSYSEDNGVTWDLALKQAHHYNASKQLARTEIWTLDEDSVTLVLGMKTDYSYNAGGKVQTSISYFLFDGEEYPSGKVIYMYDGSNRLMAAEHYVANFIELTLDESERDQYQYNTNGDISVLTYASWNGTAWADDSKDEYEYGTVDLSEVGFPAFIVLFAEDYAQSELRFGKAISVLNSFEMTGGTWKHSDITNFYYSAGSSTAIDEFANTGFEVYPNPTSDAVSFNWKGNNNQLMLKMYQITGAMVLEQNIQPGKNVSVSHLVNGIYFFKLMNGEKIVYSGKLMKR